MHAAGRRCPGRPAASRPRRSRRWSRAPGSPRPIVDKLANAVAAIVDDPTFRERHLSARSLVPAINTPEQFAAEIRKDRALAQEVVKAAGLEPQ